ncbi:SAF domain-containing protein [Micromonospora sonneratiae]|uniref:SAF domain-containing protein n=1 Tax=Micromonospora sonneratiae TaxID=1184706 RepID=A0ABW3YR38_9ACTN
MPYVALGGLLVIVCVLVYAYGAAQLGDRVQVLAVARPVAAGQAITAADLKQVSAARDPGLRLVPASQAVEVVGRTAVVPLVAGTLLTPELLGDAVFPPDGQVTASVAVKPGQYPQGLAAGARVSVYVSATARDGGQPAPAASSAATGPARLSAVVLGVDLAGNGEGSTVVTLLLAAADAPQLAAAPSGGVVLMQTSPVGS